MVSIGVKESTFMNKLFTMLNLSVILFVIIFGSVKADIHNWELTATEVIYLFEIASKYFNFISI